MLKEGDKNLMEFNESQHKVLPLWEGRTHCSGAGWALTAWGSSSAEKVLGILVDIKLSVSQLCVLAAKKSTASWAI